LWRPQGSVLGPTLWNIAYDVLLNITVQPRVFLVSFADDLAVVGVVRKVELLECLVNPVIERIYGWMAGHGLQLIHHKTEAVMLTKKFAYNPPRLSIGSVPIAVSKQLRYLVVILETRLPFGKHVETVVKKASASMAALSRFMVNVSGPIQ